MKQRGKRSNSKLVHVSFDEVERFVPRVPKQICPDEDRAKQTAEEQEAEAKAEQQAQRDAYVLSAIQAMPQGGTVAYNMARIGVPVVIHAYYIESDAILMPEQIADKVPDAVATGEMWVMAVPAAVRRIDYEIVDPYVPMRIDRNGTRERFLVWYGELKRVRYQDNWRNLSTRTARNQKAVEWFMENKPDISYRTFMSNMDDELLKLFHVELQEVWE
jgi:hypothetical protein